MLGDKLREVFDKLHGKKFITKDVIDEVSKEIQKALIVSDVNIKLVLQISKKVKELKGEKMPEGADEKEYITKRIHDILVSLFETDRTFPKNPKTILLSGLFGSGKTTSAVKLANYYKKQGFSVGIIGADTYRMGALDQLKQFGSSFDVFGIPKEKDASKVTKKGLEYFSQNNAKDVIIVDSAGRDAIDSKLKEELVGIKKVLKPEVTILVLPADIGQIALTQAKNFNEISSLNGIVLTKMDGSAKGGGALAACANLKIPVLFIGTGEKINDLEAFDATRYLSRVMGYGDLKGLLERVKDLENPEIDLEKFNFNTLKKQLSMTSKIGGFSKIANMLGFSKMIDDKSAGLAQQKTEKFNYMIDSMTPYERENPDSMNTSRIKRIAKGSGTTINEVRELIKQYKTMKDTFNTMKGKDPTKIGEGDIKGLMEKQFKKKMKKKKLKIR